MSTTIDPPLSGQDGDNRYPLSVGTTDVGVPDRHPSKPQDHERRRLQCAPARIVDWTARKNRRQLQRDRHRQRTDGLRIEEGWPGRRKEGKTRERIRVEHRRGAWDDMEVSVNTLVEDLLRPRPK